jgi:radical SAM superfamily enzyme YgiQ (UPF0313 family)
MYLSAVLKREGHEVELFIGDKDKTLEDLTVFKPDVIGVSLMGIQNEWLRGVAKHLRGNGFKQPIIVGGPEASYAPDEIIEMEGITAICVGEGEDAMKDFVDAVMQKKSFDGIDNLWVRKENEGSTEIIKNEVRKLENDLDLIFNYLCRAFVLFSNPQVIYPIKTLFLHNSIDEILHCIFAFTNTNCCYAFHFDNFVWSIGCFWSTNDYRLFEAIPS